MGFPRTSVPLTITAEPVASITSTGLLNTHPLWSVILVLGFNPASKTELTLVSLLVLHLKFVIRAIRT